jgi:hypothetical protein
MKPPRSARVNPEAVRGMSEVAAPVIAEPTGAATTAAVADRPGRGSPSAGRAGSCRLPTANGLTIVDVVPDGQDLPVSDRADAVPARPQAIDDEGQVPAPDSDPGVRRVQGLISECHQ